MQQFEIWRGSRCVIASRNGEGWPWTSRLYVNRMGTATLVVGNHKTEAGARAWARKVLARHAGEASA